MGLERTFREQETLVDVARFITVGGAVYQLDVKDYVVRTSAATSIGVILPSVSEAAGKFYAILARVAAGGNTITIVHKDDSECWNNIVLNAACEGALLYSDGMKWHVGSTAPEPNTEAPHTHEGRTRPPYTNTQPTTVPTTIPTTIPTTTLTTNLG
jgi:hypothetical protein